MQRHKVIRYLRMIEQGFMGRMMAEVIYPDLNLIDASYIGVSPRGPASSYESAYKVDLVLAGRDPIALDYYAGKYVLYSLAKLERHYPDCRDTKRTSKYWGYPYNAFHQYLTSSKKELEKWSANVAEWEILSTRHEEVAAIIASGNQLFFL